MLYLTLLVAVLNLHCFVLADSSEQNLDRIVGGDLASIEEFPWQCSLMEKGSHVCGCSIYSETHIITAAHCLEGSKAANLQVRCGSVTHDKGGVVKDVEEFKVHPMYNDGSMEYDAAVLRLASPLAFSSKIKKIDLADAPPKDGSKAMASGWGLTATNGKDLSPNLKAVTLTVMDRDACMKTSYKGNIKASMFCAGNKDGDACEGDSGGPIVDEISRVLIGITSFGFECGSNKYPGVFAEISKVTQFIKTAVKNM